MSAMTKGQLESRISENIVKFEKEYMGRGPVEVRTYIIEDMIVVRLKGVLTPAEKHLSASSEGSALIKRTRRHLLESGRALIEEMVIAITSSRIKSLHTDVSTRTGERVMIFVLEENIEKKMFS